MAVNAGELRDLVEFQRAVTPASDYSDTKPVWATYATVHGRFRPVTGAEQPTDLNVQAQIRWEGKTRWVDGVLPTDRVVTIGHTIEISSITDPEGKQHELVFTGLEVVDVSNG